MSAPTTASTQQFLEITGIKDGVIVLKNGGYRMLFSVSAVNFSLKSEQEQNSIIFQYQSFLNSLHFPIQIVMRSKRLDLNTYIKKITKIKDTQTNELIKIQAEDYIGFVTELISMANIMKKSFYVVVGYDPIMLKKPGMMDRLFNKQESASFKVSDLEFKRYRDKLVERANIVASGMGGMGLHCVQLTTEEIIELFYGIYNPEVADKERLENTGNVTSSVVGSTEEADKNQTEGQNSAEEEERIDNTAIVEEKAKYDTRVKEMEDQNQAQRQMTAAPAAPPAGTTQPAAPAQTAPASQPVLTAPVPQSIPPMAPQANPAPTPPPVAPPSPSSTPPTNPIRHDAPIT